jgi:hypothetical protein
MPEPPTPPPPEPAAAAGEQAALRSAAGVSVMAGLCPLIPLPFVDDWAEGVVRRRAVRDLLRGRGLDPTPGDVEVLAGLERAARGGCVRTLLWPVVKVSWYVVRKVFRKIVFVLAAHDAVNAAASLLVDVWLLRSALAAGVLDAPAAEAPEPGRIDRDRARRVRAAMEAAVGAAGDRPLVRAVRRAAAGSRALVLHAARGLGRWARGERRAVGGGAAGAERAAADLPVDEEQRELSGLVDRLVSALWLERGYLAALEQRFHWELSHRLVVPGGIDASVGDRRA